MKILIILQVTLVPIWGYRHTSVTYVATPVLTRAR